MRAPRKPTRRPSNPVAGAIAVNAVLIGALGLVTLQPAARAQPDDTPAGRARGNYLLVGGEVGTGSANAVWIADTVNQQLVAVRWDPSRNRVEGLGFRDLRVDAGRRENTGR